jgi:phosphoribosylformylglycinamidine synthase
MAYRTPFISGKDSLYNEFNGKPIPGTLLISAIAIVPDVQRTMTMHFKQEGDLVYLLGESLSELGGTLVYETFLKGAAAAQPATVPGLPSDPLTRYRLCHKAISEGLIRAAHDLSEGGLGVALAEMCLAGRLGASISLPPSALSTFELLFSESNGRLLLEVSPENGASVEALFAGVPLARIGTVSGDGRLDVRGEEGNVISLPLSDIERAWKPA